MIGVLGFDSRRGLGIFLFTTASRTALGPTQPPIQWVPRVLSLGVKRLGREADHSPPSSAEVKERVEVYLHSPNTPSLRGAQLKQRDSFTFYIIKIVANDNIKLISFNVTMSSFTITFILFNSVNYFSQTPVNKIQSKDNMNENLKHVQNFGRKTCREKITLQTYAQIGFTGFSKKQCVRLWAGFNWLR
jgi:hypothetical protein